MSRQITIDAIRAFNGNREFKRGNTEVKIIDGVESEEFVVWVADYCPETSLVDLLLEGYEQTVLLLHGNTIAVKDSKGTWISSGGYVPKNGATGSITTMNRLKAVTGVHSLIQRDKLWILNGVLWNGEPVKIGEWPYNEYQ